MQSRSARKLIAASAIGLAMASWLATSAKAAPLFTMGLVVPGPNRFYNPNSPAPILQALDGTDGLFGSGSAFGRAQLGNLGAKVTVVNTSLPTTPLSQRFATSVASASFDDDFPTDFAGPLGFAVLKFTVSIDGTVTTTGQGNAAELQFSFIPTSTRDPNATDGVGFDIFVPPNSFTGPLTGIAQTGVAIGVADSIHINSQIRVVASTNEAGGVIADFSQSAKINAVQLFDTAGNFIRDVALADDAGNVLPIATVPEPGSAVLLVIGMGALRVMGVRSRRRNASLVGKGSTYRH
jgi:hypothetical protein